MDRNEEKERGKEAERLITSYLWDEAWETLEQSLLNGWRSTGTGQTERREMIYAQLKAAEFVRKYVEEALRTGRLALEQERSEHERTSRLNRGTH